MHICILMLMQVCLLFWREEKKKAHVPTALDYSKIDAAAAGKISDHTWSNSLAEFDRHPPAPPKDLLHGIV